ncbi:MAG TPA: flagella basal body P-ring formation protein FlgA [Kofleriaceae bacterium]|jgi:flagella basal body P-ring formation protein FlgA
MKALVILALLAGAAHADTVQAIVRAKVEAALPEDLGVAHVFVPRELEAVDTDASRVAVEIPAGLGAGHPSVRVTVRGHKAAAVPLSIAALVECAVAQRELQPGDAITAADVAVARRAMDAVAFANPALLDGATAAHVIAAGATIGARDVVLPPPLPRGTSVAIEVHRGAVTIRGTGTLESAARPGQPAIALLVATRTVVHGTLVAPNLLIAGEL